MNTVTCTCILRTLARTIDFNIVAMLTYDVSLGHFGKTMLYTGSTCVAYSYLLYTRVTVEWEIIVWLNDFF